jgi:hypothetical protein
MNKRSLFTITVTLFLFFITLNIPYASAQLTGLGSNEVVITSNPKYPEPGNQTTLTVSNGVIDLDRATIIWYQNGVEKTRGIGKKVFTFTAGGAGSETTVRAVVQSLQGPSFNSEIIIRPATLDLLWEAETVTPPLYKGKALPGSESVVRVVALPRFVYNGSVLNVSDLYYEWRVGSRLLSSSSGKGKNTIIITAPKTYGKTNITVTVSSALHSFSAQKTTSIESVPPEVHFYSVSPERGFNVGEALADQLQVVGDFTIQAIPYYFSKNKTISFNWTQNGSFIKNQNSRISFTGGENPSGPSSIGLSVNGQGSLLQFAEKSLLITPKQ